MAAVQPGVVNTVTPSPIFQSLTSPAQQQLSAHAYQPACLVPSAINELQSASLATARTTEVVEAPVKKELVYLKQRLKSSLHSRVHVFDKEQRDKLGATSLEKVISRELLNKVCAHSDAIAKAAGNQLVGHCHLIMGQYETARKHYLQALQQKEAPLEDADVGFGITVCTFFLAEHRRVIVLADLILKRHPRHEMRRSVMAYQALALLEVASYKDALVMFRHLLIEQGHLFINLHEMLLLTAFCHEKLGQFKEAFKALELIILEAGNKPICHHAIAQALLRWVVLFCQIPECTRLAPNADPVANLKCSLKIDPNCTLAWYWLSRLMIERGELPAAILAVSAALKCSTKVPCNWMCLGLTCQLAKLPLQAWRAYQCSIHVDARDSRLLSNLATLYKEDGNYHSAAYFVGLAIIQHHGASSPALTSLEKQQQACLKLAKVPPAATQPPRLLPSHEYIVWAQGATEENLVACFNEIPTWIEKVKITKSEWQLAIDKTQNVQLRLDVIDQTIGRYEFENLDAMVTSSDSSVRPAAERRSTKRGGSGGQRNSQKSRKVAASTSDRERRLVQPQPQLDGSKQRKGKRARTAGEPSKSPSNTDGEPLATKSVREGKRPLASHTSVGQGFADGELEKRTHSRPPLKPKPVVGGSAALKQVPSLVLGEAIQLADEGSDSSAVDRIGANTDASSPAENRASSIRVITVYSPKHAKSKDLRDRCQDPAHPATIIRGLVQSVGLKTSEFDMALIAQQCGEEGIEVRSQRLQNADQNWDDSMKKQVWPYKSDLENWRVKHYVRYLDEAEPLPDGGYSTFDGATGPVPRQMKISQAERGSDAEMRVTNAHRSDTTSMGKPAKEELFSTLKFGTNVDLSEKIKWMPQLMELQKLPMFLRADGNRTDNLLSQLSIGKLKHTILGINTVQMYLKATGSRTPAHQENNNFVSGNMSFGPGRCVWYTVDRRYWKKIEALCDERNIDCLFGSWWPNLADLDAAKIPYQRFIQEPGDFVYTNCGTVHWVQSLGRCTNVAWNLGPTTGLQLELAWTRYLYHQKKKQRSLVPMHMLTWRIVWNHKSYKDVSLLAEVRRRASYSIDLQKDQLAQATVLNMAPKKHLWGTKDDADTAYVCFGCHDEVFNQLFVESGTTNKESHEPFCFKCAAKTQKKGGNMSCLSFRSLEELEKALEAFNVYADDFF